MVTEPNPAQPDKQRIKSAIEDAVAKVKANLQRHGGDFPHIGMGRNKEYDWGSNEDWIEGFYTGLVWLCYEYDGDSFFRRQAELQVNDFAARLEAKVLLDHHDIGFLYGPSAFAGWVVTGNEALKSLALRAADHLFSRWREAAGVIQAWGPEGDPENGGRIIIDCLMNLPLLYWAGAVTGDDKYAVIAKAHAEKARRFLVRGDDSSYHTFYFDPQDGGAIRGGTHQGFRDGSTWTRGQAWGIYGFALSYRYTGDLDFLETSKRMARYFIERIPDDGVVYWDFDVPVDQNTIRDSSASAIAACGMLELLSHLEPDDELRQQLQAALSRTMEALTGAFSTIGQPEAEGLIDHGSYYVRGELGLDGYMVWGDYYYLEALMRIWNGVPGYWYERPQADKAPVL